MLAASPVWTNGWATLYQAAAQEIPLPDQSVHMVVTSPPYWALRSYRSDDARMLGSEATAEEFLANLVGAFREVWRVLRDDGSCWVNIGDTRDGLNAAMIPARFALAMQAHGWILRDAITWAKPSPMPESVRGWVWEPCRVKVAARETVDNPDVFNDGKYRHHVGTISNSAQAQWSPCPGCAKCEANGGLVLRRGHWRTTNASEMIYLFIKKPGAYLDGEAVKQPVAESTVGRVALMDGRSKSKALAMSLFAAEVELSKAGDQSPEGETKQGDRYKAGQGRGVSRGQHVDHLVMRPSSSGANLRNVWSDITPEAHHFAHFATFPTGLATRCILAGTSEAGVCIRCQAPFARVVEPPTGGSTGQSWHDHEDDAGRGAQQKHTGSELHATYQPARTLSWRATCGCPDAPPVPATVLDPFGGTMTTCIAAMRLGRRSVGLDLSLEYLEIAKRRLAAETLPMGAK